MDCTSNTLDSEAIVPIEELNVRIFRQLNLKNAVYFGFEAQSNQLIEECAELIQAVNKYKRALGKGQPTANTVEQAKEHVAEEIADVLVMTEQIAALLDIDHNHIVEIMEKKIERTSNRILRSEQE